MIIETDIGHDPDDFFTICYLVSVGVKIEAILITPGDLDQIAICRFLCDQLDLDIPIGVAKVSQKYSSGSVHHHLLKKYKCKFEGTPDGMGYEIIDKLIKENSELFIIGPPSNVGRYLKENPDVKIAKLTMQGGFLGYDIHPHATFRIPRFEGKTYVQTFNMNGNIEGTKALFAANIGERRFCGKNVCHTVIFDKDKLSGMYEAKDRASELFLEGMGILLEKRTEGKKFHDPVAAVCHLHPEIGTWVKGKIERTKEGWGTVLDENGDCVLANIDYNAFWNHIQNWE